MLPTLQGSDFMSVTLYTPFSKPLSFPSQTPNAHGKSSTTNPYIPTQKCSIPMIPMMVAPRRSMRIWYLMTQLALGLNNNQEQVDIPTQQHLSLHPAPSNVDRKLSSPSHYKPPWPSAQPTYISLPRTSSSHTQDRHPVSTQHHSQSDPPSAFHSSTASHCANLCRASRSISCIDALHRLRERDRTQWS